MLATHCAPGVALSQTACASQPYLEGRAAGEGGSLGALRERKDSTGTAPAQGPRSSDPGCRSGATVVVEQPTDLATNNPSLRACGAWTRSAQRGEAGPQQQQPA